MPSWGEDKNEPLPDLPQSHETEPDINGIKTITTYRKNELGQTIKVTQKVRVSKHTVKVSKPVLARRQWAKFGACQGKPRGYHGAGYQDAATTTIDISEQVLEMNPKEQVKEEKNESAQRAFEKMNAIASEAWRPKQRDTSLAAAAEWAEANGLASATGDDKRIPDGAGLGSLAALASRQGAGGYVPPSLRNADGSRNAAMAERDDSCTVRVSNLSEDVKDSDLRELFRRFGAIQRIYLAKDRETHQSRGFAFINFFSREDGQRAIDKLDGHGYDHLILSVSWANPSAGGDGPKAAPPTGAAFGPALGSGGPGGGGASRFEGRGSIADRYDKQVFDSGLDRFR
jgi:translation initiation factor 3 subunit G|eukprot:jgi/Chrpa1/16625/Chrysochromulina_OHIO_Genome00007857-RA